MRLHEEKEFQDAVIAASQHSGISEVIVEKDYWVTYTLKNIVLKNITDKVVFKGGTSLSKAFKIINRFSEDIDLAAIGLEGKNGNQTRSAIRNISKLVASNLKEVDNERSVKGNFMRKTFHAYPVESVTSGIGDVQKNVLIEINSITSNLTYQMLPIISMIGEYLGKQDHNLLSKYELEPFEINVLDKKRTFSEKILAIARYSKFNDENAELKSKIRHFYDICMLFRLSEIKIFVNSDDFLNLTKIIIEDDNSTSIFGKPWENDSIQNAPIIKEPEPVWKELRSTYNGSDLSALIFKDKPVETEVLDTILSISERIKQM
jgi:hypothetical protein